jgi:multiple sugar transport system permease protein
MADRAARSGSTTPPAGAGGVASSRPAPKKKHYSLLTRRDTITLWVMAGIPTLLVGVFILLPTLASIVLSFTSWNGIGGLGAIKFIGLKNYSDLINVYQPFFPALEHNLIWLVFFLLIATPLGMFFAVLLDKNIRGTRIYQSAL